MPTWNLWHGCHKISPGCQHCYVYRIDGSHGRQSSNVYKTKGFSLPIQKARSGEYKIPPGSLVYTCLTSDFFIEEADPWRQEAWDLIRSRPDLDFFIITKRVHRILPCLPDDWGGGYFHVHICCTVEDQKRADSRLPVFLNLPIRHKSIICEPLLENIQLLSYLLPSIEKVIVGGETGEGARVCDYDWVLNLREQCKQRKIAFEFMQTGSLFRKDGKYYRLTRNMQKIQARKANLDLPSSFPSGINTELH